MTYKQTPVSYIPLVPKDYFGNVIEIGDSYFKDHDTFGFVAEIDGEAITIDISLPKTNIDWDGRIRLSRPERGVCLNKIPGKGKIEYKVTWRVWKGIETCGSSDYAYHSQIFDDLSKARECFALKQLHCDDAKLIKIVTKQLDGVLV